ncbi:hypothetical protein [Streptomyces sp. NBC_00996]|uniref:hypothetical protein n=1 Tax=Streptomyces sp. NBC_00996 TaxID=2903710 RepID=UPI0038689CFC|nr:hypothetical protein OG390_47630 [Streptomyces sp. NBC_00996]
MTDRSRSEGRNAWSRRGFLLSAATLVAGPPLSVRGSAAAADLPGFPDGVDVYRTAYRNWVGEITASPHHRITEPRLCAGRASAPRRPLGLRAFNSS